MSFAKEMQEVAEELLNEFDEREDKMILRVAGESYFDTNLAETVIGETQEYELTGVAPNYREGLINGTTIQNGDIQLSVLCEVEPTQAHKVVIDGVEASIVAVNPVAYTGKDKTIMYKIQVRR